MAAMRVALYDIVEAERPMTVRQVFYQAVSRGIIEKTEAEYKGTICRLLVDMRRAGDLPYDWITDHTRYMRRPRTFSGVADAIYQTALFYRKALWDDLPVRVEIWLEKEALSGVLDSVTSVYDVPLMVTRGYPSLSFLHGAGMVIAADSKPTYIYYFGDLDPSGIDIPVKVEREIRAFAPDVELHFEVVAVRPDMVTSWNLPTRPTKKSDSRSKSFDGDSVEVDAIAPRDLRSLCQACLDRHLPEDQLSVLLEAEASEREALEIFANEVMA